MAGHMINEQWERDQRRLTAFRENVRNAAGRGISPRAQNIDPRDLASGFTKDELAELEQIAHDAFRRDQAAAERRDRASAVRSMADQIAKEREAEQRKADIAEARRRLDYDHTIG